MKKIPVVKPDYTEFLLIKVDCAGTRKAMEIFDDVPAMAKFMRNNCSLNDREVMEALAGENSHSLEIFIIKPVSIKTAYTYTIEEL